MMLAQAVIFVVDAVGGFFATLFLLRFLMQAMRVSFAGPLGSFVIALSNWAVKPLRRIIPGIGGLDWSSVFAAFVIELIVAVVVLGFSAAGLVLESSYLALLVAWVAFRNLLRLVIYIMMGALILQAVLSWVNPYSPLSAPADQLTRPLLGPIRRIIPLMGGIDLSPMVGILLLQLVLMFL